MNKTKKKIILSAVKLFNLHGLNNVRNQDIAKDAGISLSNFNYHYKTKKDLVLAVFDYMKTVLEEKVYGNKLLVTEGQSLFIAKTYFEFEEEFQFFYLDTHNIIQSYPELKEEFNKLIQEAVQMIKNFNYMAVGMGMMIPEPPEMPGLYDRLAEQIWSNNHFWLAQTKIRDFKGNVVINGMESGFAMVYPYLTEKGRVGQRAFIEMLKNEQEGKKEG